MGKGDKGLHILGVGCVLGGSLTLTQRGNPKGVCESQREKIVFNISTEVKLFVCL